MSDPTIVHELRMILQPFIKEHPQKKDTVLEEDVESLISGAIAFHVEEDLLKQVKNHPDGVFWDFLDVLPDGAPPGQEKILVDLLSDDED